MAAEQEAQRSAARRKRMGIVAAGVLVAAVAVIAVLAVASGNDDGGGGDGVALPPRQIENLAEAARAAGCKVAGQKNAGSGHTSDPVKYETNPPTSGDHDPTASREGIYAPGNSPDVEQSVHALEHGRVNIQYRKGTPQARIDQLETLFNEEVRGTEGYKTLVFENQTNMEPAVAVTAWTRVLTCPQFNDRVFDAVRAFREQNVDKGPEAIPSEFE